MNVLFAHHRHIGFYMHAPIGKKLRLIQLYNIMLKYQYKIDHTHIVMWMIKLTTRKQMGASA